MAHPNVVNQHYGQPDLAKKILTALQNSGKDIKGLTEADLTSFDQFHSGGLDATRRLAELAALGAGMQLLDVGCGIGGPARVLAAEYGCQVTGIELTETFFHAAERLTACLGLDDKVSFQQGDALDMPFAAASFDVVWTQNVLMNIEDKRCLFSEMRRVLRPGGRLALFALMQGPVPTLHYPVMWASSADLAFLVPPEELRQLIVESGFREISWIEGRSAASQSAAAPIEKNELTLGMDILVDEAFQLKKSNGRRNMAEGRTTYVTGVFERTCI